MAFEVWRAQVAELFAEAINEPQDIDELRVLLTEKLNEMRATGMPIPEDLLELEQRLQRGMEGLEEAE